MYFLGGGAVGGEAVGDGGRGVSKDKSCKDLKSGLDQHTSL